jgi:hypothetical protein
MDDSKQTIIHPTMTANRRTICEVHKEIHDIVFEYIPDEDIRRLALAKVDDAYDMGKRMDKKLKEYAYCIAKTEWRGWDRVTPYRKLIKFYRRLRKRGMAPPDPYRTEANDLRDGIKRDPKKDGYIDVKTVWPKEWEEWEKRSFKNGF